MSQEQTRNDKNVTKADVCKKENADKGRNNLTNAETIKGKGSEDGNNTKIIENDETSAHENGSEDEEWITVVSKKRKSFSKSTKHDINVNNNESSNVSSSDDSFIHTYISKKKKVAKSNPKKGKKVNSKTSKCPICKKSLESVLKHMSKGKGKHCKSQCSNEQLEELQNVSKVRTAMKKKELNLNIPKEQIKNKNKKFYERMKKEDPKAMKNMSKITSSRHRSKQNPDVLKDYQRKVKSKSRIADTEHERLKNFLVSTIHNAVFICISCHQRCFKSNVVEYTKKVKDSISSGRISKHLQH